MRGWTFFERCVFVWALTLGTVAVVAAVSGLGLWISDNSSNVASWVQAVGSIAAVGAVFMGIQYQQRVAAAHQRAVESEAKRQRAFRLAVRLYQAYQDCDFNVRLVIEYLNQKAYAWKAFADYTERSLEQFTSIDIGTLEDTEDIANVVAMQTNLRVLDRMLHQAIGKELPPKQVEIIYGSLKKLGSTLTTPIASQLRKARENAQGAEKEALEKLKQSFDSQEALIHGINHSDTDKPQTPLPSAPGQ